MLLLLLLYCAQRLIRQWTKNKFLFQWFSERESRIYLSFSDFISRIPLPFIIPPLMNLILLVNYFPAYFLLYLFFFFFFFLLLTFCICVFVSVLIWNQIVRSPVWQSGRREKFVRGINNNFWSFNLKLNRKIDGTEEKFIT